MNEAILHSARDKQLFAQRNDQLGHLTGPILRDLARNESASREWRKAAIELMLDKGCVEVNHPDLFALVMEVKSQREAKDEVQSIVEAAIEAPLDEAGMILKPWPLANHPAPQPLKDLAGQVAIVQPTGPFKAGFTTANLTQDETVA
jgi:hypothetical protein